VYGDPLGLYLPHSQDDSCIRWIHISAALLSRGHLFSENTFTLTTAASGGWWKSYYNTTVFEGVTEDGSTVAALLQTNRALPTIQSFSARIIITFTNLKAIF
jgi:hypothetical protein